MRELLVALVGFSVGCGGAHLTVKQLVEHNKPSIVRIEAETGHGTAVGTGFVVGDDGRIATNLHVIADARVIRVKLVDGSEHLVDHVVAVDEQHDLAIVSIPRRGLPTVTLGDSDEVAAGDRVVAIGNPLGVLDYSVSDGLISSVRPIDANVTVLQISAPISQGSSGGPLFNPGGEVIGVATFIATDGQNLNFGMPSNYLRPLLARRGGETMAVWAKRFEKKEPQGQTVHREVPVHPVSLLDGCSREQIGMVLQAISNAIELGAPVYNRGEPEACFVIYRRVAEQFEADQTMCKGIRDAFGQGLLRVNSVDGPADKAWALRDTFDGLLDVIDRKTRGM